MADLRTQYLGLELRAPLVASSSPLTGTLDGLKRLRDAGAGAVVLPSLFEEDLAEAARAGSGAAAYLELLEQAKASLSIPVIASLNGTSRGGWVRHAARLEQAGADAIELNIYYVSSSPGQSGSEVEWRYLDIVHAVRQAAGVPLAVKLSPYFSSVTNMAGQLVEAGANGLVLFNRFYQPDLDVETLEVVPSLELSTSAELRLPLRWIAILHGRHRISLAASTGVHTAEDVVKALLAGADVAMMTSALLRHGPDHLSQVEAQLSDWLDRHGHRSLDQVRGRLSQRSVRDPAAFERALGSVGETMTGEVVLLAADAPAEAALRRLVQRAISGAPVVDRGRVVDQASRPLGVMTRHDVLRAVARRTRPGVLGSAHAPHPGP